MSYVQSANARVAAAEGPGDRLYETWDADRSSKNSARLGPGAYGLLFEVSQQLVVPTGRLGVCTYPVGWYAYIGSALGGLTGRIKHHLGPHKRPRWHIDYLLPLGELSAIVAAETHERVECLLAAFLSRRFSVVSRFGSSDCRCAGHCSEVRPGLLFSTLCSKPYRK